MRRLADDPRVAALAPDLDWDFPLRFLAALHYLVLGGEASWDDVGAVLDSRSEWVREFVRTQPVQTNEVQRAWALLPGLLSVGAERIDLLELGTAGGLLLGLDGFAYRYRSGSWGSGSLVLSGDDRGGPPASLLARGLEIVRRRGVDQHPVDVTTEDGARLLRSFVWPGEGDRAARLEAAIEIARARPPELIAGDYVEGFPRDVAPGAELVVVTCVTTAYLSDEEFEALAAQLEGITWLSLDMPRHARDYHGMQLRLNDRVLAEHVDFHGKFMDWC